MAYAEEDALEDEVEVEGELDVEETAGSEEDEELKSTASPDADTTILFVKPVSTGASQMGVYNICYKKSRMLMFNVF